jgi:hypothetical protein
LNNRSRRQWRLPLLELELLLRGSLLIESLPEERLELELSYPEEPLLPRLFGSSRFSERPMF